MKKNESKELVIEQIMEKYKTTKKIAVDLYDTIFNSIGNQLLENGSATVGNIGVLYTSDRESKMTRNPKTNEYVISKPYKKVKIKVTKEYQEKGLK